MSDYFECSVEGCEEAKQFLIENGKEWIVSDWIRTDGYTMVALANQLKRELDNE